MSDDLARARIEHLEAVVTGMLDSSGVRRRQLETAERGLAEARAWIEEAHRSLVWIVEFGGFGGRFAEHLSALVERCPVPKEGDDG